MGGGFDLSLVRVRVGRRVGLDGELVRIQSSSSSKERAASKRARREVSSSSSSSCCCCCSSSWLGILRMGRMVVGGEVCDVSRKVNVDVVEKKVGEEI